MKRVLVLGASGNVGPYVTPGLEPHYELQLADIKPHPSGRPILSVDVRSYDQVLQACRGMDAILSFTVLRDDPVQSFRVNTLGTYHLMRAALECGIRKVVNTAAQSARYWYDHDFDVDDVPEWPGPGYYMLTKYLGMEISRAYARVHGIQTVFFLFNGLGPAPSGPVVAEEYPCFTVVWEDLQDACRLALDIESVPGGFQCLNMLSYLGMGKYGVDKARRLLGFQPRQDWEEAYRRVP
ncbi:MAG: NAD-dependent epimerase/dehydratase family protein [Candidatus Latescibacterota bacterium]